MDRIHAYLVHSDWREYLKSWTNQHEEEESFDEIKEIKEDDEDHVDIGIDHLQYGDKFISEFGFGQKHNHIEITNKYKSIYDELMFNDLCPKKIDEQEWQNKLIKAIKKHHIAISLYSKTLMCKHYHPHYRLCRNQPIGIRHILAIILYTDLSEFCKSFRETYRMMDIDDVKETKYEQVKQRHRQFYYIGRALYEAVEFFGENMKPSMRVHHGLGIILFFERFSAQFNQPISTTTTFSKAHQFSKGIGIILTLKVNPKSTSTPRFLSVSWLSTFPSEDEKLFYGSNVEFQIVNIYEANHLKPYKAELALFNKFQRLIQNEQVEWEKDQRKRLLKFVEEQQKYESKEKKDDNDEMEMSYAKGLFNCFCRHPNATSVQINNYKTMDRSVSNALLQSDSSPSVIPLLRLFPYLQRIEFNNIELNDMTDDANNYLNIILKYIEEIKTLKSSFLKQILFQTRKEHPKKSKEDFHSLQKQFNKTLYYMRETDMHDWTVKYNMKDTFIFTNNDEKELNRVMEEQKRQQQLEQYEAERKRVRMKRKQNQVSLEQNRAIINTQKVVKSIAKKQPKTVSKSQKEAEYLPHISRIDYHLQNYYNQLGEKYDSKFRNYCDENGFDDNFVETELLYSDIQDSLLINFDEYFPFHPDHNDLDKDRMIHHLLNQFLNNIPYNYDQHRRGLIVPSTLVSVCMSHNLCYLYIFLNIMFLSIQHCFYSSKNNGT